MISDAVERVLAALPDAKRNGKDWIARCPAHDDRRPSLSIAQGDDGRALLHCHAGCSNEDIVAALGWTMTQLMPPATGPHRGRGDPRIKKAPAGRPRARKKLPTVYQSAHDAIAALERQLGPRSKEWTYQAADGNPVGVIVRWDTPAPAPGSGKDIRPVSKTLEGWIIGGMPEPRPLYRLPELMAAAASGKRVYVCEGEKAADAARSVGLIATTSPHGSKSAAKTDWSPLKGSTASSSRPQCEVVILPDADEPGERYAEDVVSLLTRLSPPPIIKVIRLPGLPFGQGGDMADFEELRGGDIEAIKREVEALADKAPLIQIAVPGALDIALGVVPGIDAYTPYPVDALPRVLHDYVNAVAEAMRTERACAALAALTVCAAAIGTSRSVRLKRRWRENAQLWAVVVAEQGSGKSPPMREAIRPLIEQQRRELDRHAEALQLYETQVAEYQREMKRYQAGKTSEAPAKPEPPPCVRYVVSDTTLEALAPILLENPRGVLLDGDELAGWFGAMDRYAQAKQGDAAAWRRIYDGHDITIDRKTNRQMIHVPKPAVSIIGTIQPEILRQTLSAEHQESGLAARWLLAFPPRRPIVWSDADIPQQVEANYERLVHDLLALKPAADRDGRTEPLAVPLTRSARKRFVEWHDQHRSEQADLSGVLSGHWSKLVSCCARLALILQMIRQQSGEADGDQIDEASVDAAIMLTAWHKAEAQRVYAMLAEDEEGRERRRLVEMVEHRGGKVSVRDWQRGRSYRTAKDAKAELEAMVAAGLGQWKEIASGSKGGRPSKQFVLVEPKIQSEPAPVPRANETINPEEKPLENDDWGEL